MNPGKWGHDGTAVAQCIARWPRFDSPACFAALLGEPENGRWLLAPANPKARVSRHYLDGSIILATRWETTEGAVDVLDFMPPDDGVADLVRLVRAVLALRFGRDRADGAAWRRLSEA